MRYAVLKKPSCGKQFLLLCSTGLLSVILCGCLGGGGGDSAPGSTTTGGGTTTTTATVTTTTLAGRFVDSPVQGVEYRTSGTCSLSGITDADGKFTYCTGDKVRFSLGDKPLGEEVNGQEIVTPYTLVPTATSPTDRKVMNIAKLLQSLDSGGSIATKIVISDAHKTAIRNANVGTINFDQATAAFAADSNVGKILTAASKTLRSDTETFSHLSSQMASNLGLTSTTFGKVQGKLSSSSPSITWMGIPYAAPPTGALRWKAPTDPTPWTTTKDLASTAPNACIQKNPVTDKVDGVATTINQSEDCLTLNVWRPASGETNLPVLFFIHGGSNKIGYGGASAYSGEKLANEQKVVVVSINYRLNLFGFLQQAALQSDADPLGKSGNFALLDMMQALKFVKNNIANFGGNPSNVTIAGQSAGAINVWALLSSPQASGLFHKAIPMSGFLPSGSTTGATTFANNLLRRLAINAGNATNDTTADTWIATNLGTNELKSSYLRSKSAADLITAFSGVENYFTHAILDGTVLPPDTATMFTGNYLNNVPILVGVTNEEGKYYGRSYHAVTTEKWDEMLTSDPNNITLGLSDVIKPAYLPVNKVFTSCADSGYTAVMLSSTYCFGNTTFFWQGGTNALNKYKPLQARTYAYNFKWAQQPEPIKTAVGAAHTVDVPFLFGTTAPGASYMSAAYIYTGLSNANRPGAEALSLKMRQFLKSFMLTGDPNNSALGVTWTPWVANAPNRLVLDADNTTPNVYMSTSATPLTVQ